MSASLNVVSGLSSSLAGATAIGIGVNTSPRTAKVFRNKVYDIQITGATGTVTGMSAGGVTNDFYNNLVGDLRAPSATSTGNPNVIGLEAALRYGGHRQLLLQHGVYRGDEQRLAVLDGGGVRASGSVLKLRNNIVANASIPTGGGRAVAVWRNYQPLWNYDTSSNNNDLYASTAYYDGVTAYTTLSDMWAVVYPRESASFSENPPFLSTVGSSANFLHIVPASLTLLESHAVNIAGITDDYDTDIRQGNPGYGGTGTAPDVGADEFEGVAQGDVQPPAIVYSLLGAGAPSTSRTLTATITDATGVATTAGVRPRLYFKKSTDANDETGWKYVEAIGSGDSPFDFTIDYTMLNGGSVSVGDTIQYFVVAQDTVATPNVGIFQGAFAAPPTSVALTPAAFPIGGTINSYTIITSISGALTVCPSGCDYDSLTNAGGLFETLNGRVFTGNVTVDILGDSTAETGLNALNQWPEDPAGNFTLTIRPGGGAARTVSGSFAGGLIRLNGADRVTIDGLNTDGNSLTVSNTSTTNPSATIHLLPTGIFEAGASNNTIRNLNIVGGANTIGVVGIAISGATVNTAGAGQRRQHDQREHDHQGVLRDLRPRIVHPPLGRHGQPGDLEQHPRAGLAGGGQPRPRRHLHVRREQPDGLRQHDPEHHGGRRLGGRDLPGAGGGRRLDHEQHDHERDLRDQRVGNGLDHRHLPRQPRFEPDRVGEQDPVGVEHSCVGGRGARHHREQRGGRHRHREQHDLGHLLLRRHEHQRHQLAGGHPRGARRRPPSRSTTTRSTCTDPTRASTASAGRPRCSSAAGSRASTSATTSSRTATTTRPSTTERTFADQRGERRWPRRSRTSTTTTTT